MQLTALRSVAATGPALAWWFSKRNEKGSTLRGILGNAWWTHLPLWKDFDLRWNHRQENEESHACTCGRIRLTKRPIFRKCLTYWRRRLTSWPLNIHQWPLPASCRWTYPVDPDYTAPSLHSSPINTSSPQTLSAPTWCWATCVSPIAIPLLYRINSSLL